jgi:hypothetical protein
MVKNERRVKEWWMDQTGSSTENVPISETNAFKQCQHQIHLLSLPQRAVLFVPRMLKPVPTVEENLLGIP